jgi:tRNA (cmo5U34)-methyltransferase
MDTKIDRFFARPLEEIPPFSFNAEVAEVFDDMVARSVPLYRENQQMMVQILSRLLRPRDTVYDLGCSTGSALVQVGTSLKQLDLKLVGLDTSAPMVEKARLKTRAFGLNDAVIEVADITQFELATCGGCIMNYTLQFIPVSERSRFLQKIFQALRPGGVLLLAEKIEADTTALQELLTDVYYDLKRSNGYSELEISQKREALEDVLVPLPAHTQQQLLRDAGFTHVETILRWGPFATFLAVKA